MKQYKKHLCDQWFVRPEAEGITDESLYYTQCDEGACRVSSLPAQIKDLFPKAKTPIWYYKRFPAPRDIEKGHRVYLCFDRVVCLCRAWVNGIPVGSHNHSEEPFEFDVTDALQEDNLIALQIFGPLHDVVGPEGISMHTVPNYAQIYNYYTSVPMTGIYGEVSLTTKPLCFIQDLYLAPHWETGIVHTQLCLKNRSAQEQEVLVQYHIYEKGTLVTTHSHLATLAPEACLTNTTDIPMEDIHLWSVDDPYLYTIQVSVNSAFGTQETQKRFGFRSLCIEDGFFVLNGKRIFLTCAHSIQTKEAVVHAKTMGFRALRYLSAMPSEEILDFCDEIGMLVYEECAVSWGMHDYPDMPLHMSAYLDNMIRRDRSHVSVGIWGIFNEQAGPNDKMRSRKLKDTAKVFDFAVSYLPQMRRLDPTRLILLSSGRWDARADVGSFSNPYCREWNYGWGEEAPDFVLKEFQKAPRDLDPYIACLGDNHLYPTVPLQKDVVDFIRSIGKNSKPVFLSEYGVGSQLELYDLYQENRQTLHEDHPQLPYFAVQIQRLEEWIRHYGMDKVYPTPRDFLMASIHALARQRRESIDPIRANPQLCGYSMTSFTVGNEGVYYRSDRLIPSVVDAIRDSFAPLKWSIFPEQTQLYAQTPSKAQFVLCNEDVLPAGSYTATVSLTGSKGVVFSRPYCFSYPENKPLAAEVLTVSLPPLCADEYTLAIHLDGHCQPAGNTRTLRVHDLSHLPKLSGTFFAIGDLGQADAFLSKHGLSRAASPKKAKVIAVGAMEQDQWATRQEEVFALARSGKKVLLLSHGLLSTKNTSAQAFMQSIDYSSDESDRPLFSLNSIYVRNWLYHMDSYAADPALVDGLCNVGLMDMDLFRRVYPDHYLIDTPKVKSTLCASFGSGLFAKDHCIGALTMGEFSFGEGSITVNTFKLLENVGKDPVADRLLYNLFRLQ